MFIPWAGYFDIMAGSDVFVSLDNVQYTKADWRNRNRIKTSDTVTWLTVPVRLKGHVGENINEIEVDRSSDWEGKHLASLEHSYKRAPFFDGVMDIMARAYGRSHALLVDLDMDILREFAKYISLETPVLMASEMPSSGTKTERLISLLREAGAERYLSGTSAKSYLDEAMLAKAGIEVAWHGYSHPYYNQIWMKRQGFVSHLSVIDLLFNHGPDSLDIITGKVKIERPDWVKISNANEMERTAAGG